MRLAHMWLFLILMEVAMLIFTGTAENTPTMLQNNLTTQMSTNMTSPATNVTAANSQDTWNLFFDPVNWNNNTFITLLLTGLIVGGAIGIGTYFFFRSDLTILYPLFTIIVGSGMIPIMQFWNLMNSGVATYSCEAGQGCFTSVLLSGIICVPLTLYWIAVCLEWWSGRPTS